MSMPTQDGVFLWQDEASCGGLKTSEFFDNEKEAKKICTDCPVRSICLETALVYNYSGVWGGLTEKERRKLPVKDTRFLREDYEESGMYNPILKV
jgi:WhiB family redox-sensing transcriptional regulator